MRQRGHSSHRPPDSKGKARRQSNGAATTCGTAPPRRTVRKEAAYRASTAAWPPAPWPAPLPNRVLSAAHQDAPIGRAPEDRPLPRWRARAAGGSGAQEGGHAPARSLRAARRGPRTCLALHTRNPWKLRGTGPPRTARGSGGKVGARQRPEGGGLWAMPHRPRTPAPNTSGPSTSAHARTPRAGPPAIALTDASPERADPARAPAPTACNLHARRERREARAPAGEALGAQASAEHVDGPAARACASGDQTSAGRSPLHTRNPWRNVSFSRTNCNRGCRTLGRPAGLTQKGDCPTPTRRRGRRRGKEMREEVGSNGARSALQAAGWHVRARDADAFQNWSTSGQIWPFPGQVW